jgi:Cu/Ag efflux pump CusA
MNCRLINVGVLARWTVRPRLLGIPGVANVVLWGQRERQLQVQVDPRRLREHAVSLQQVISTTGNAQFPRGYHAELLGESAERQAAQDRLRLLGAAAGIGVFLLLVVAFRSWRLATMFFVRLPMALVGGVLAAWLTGGTLSLGSLVGFFTVFGIAARNGILLINHYQHLEREEGEPFGLQLVLRGALERVSPILMTALATGLALVPSLIYGDIPGHEIEHPIAVVIVGGLVTSTFINLFVVPALYLRFAKPRGARRRTSFATS